MVERRAVNSLSGGSTPWRQLAGVGVDILALSDSEIKELCLVLLLSTDVEMDLGGLEEAEGKVIQVDRGDGYIGLRVVRLEN